MREEEDPKAEERPAAVEVQTHEEESKGKWDPEEVPEEEAHVGRNMDRAMAAPRFPSTSLIERHVLDGHYPF